LLERREEEMSENIKKKLWICVGVVCVGIVATGFFVLWRQDRNKQLEEQNQIIQQQTAGSYVTLSNHDFSTLLPYRTLYMGDNTKMVNLFNHLLLTRAGVKIQLLSTELTIQVEYQTSIEELKAGNVQVALVYNSLAAFALVDNLEYLTYEFPDGKFQVSRALAQDMLNAFLGTSLEALADPKIWKDTIQIPMEENTEFTQSLFQWLFPDENISVSGSFASTASGGLNDTTGMDS
jgi:hypothetical protein